MNDPHWKNLNKLQEKCKVGADKAASVATILRQASRPSMRDRSIELSLKARKRLEQLLFELIDPEIYEGGAAYTPEWKWCRVQAPNGALVFQRLRDPKGVALEGIPGLLIRQVPDDIALKLDSLMEQTDGL